MTERIKDFHIVILLYYYHDTDITDLIGYWMKYQVKIKHVVTLISCMTKPLWL